MLLLLLTLLVGDGGFFCSLWWFQDGIVVDIVTPIGDFSSHLYCSMRRYFRIVVENATSVGECVILAGIDDVV